VQAYSVCFAFFVAGIYFGVTMNDYEISSLRKSAQARKFALITLVFFLLPLFGCIEKTQVLPSSTPAPVVILVSTNAATATPPIDTTASPTPVSSPEQFSIIWLADTQNIANHQDSDVFKAMGEWILEQEDSLNIKYIVQTGDMVENGFKEKQWKSFDVLLGQFYGKIPYFPIAGNHDLGVKLEDYSAYLELPFIKMLPQDHVYGHGRAIYAEFQAGGQSFLLLGAGWNEHVTSSVWMNEVLRAHPNHIAILMFHSYIDSDGQLSHQGIEIHDMIVAKNPNVRLVLCGHLRGNGYRLEEFDDDRDGEMDRVVNAMLYNYQNYDITKSGQIRVLSFDTATRNLHVFTYSPFTKRYYEDDSFHSTAFDLPNAF